MSLPRWENFPRLDNHGGKLTLDRHNHEDRGDADETGVPDLGVEDVRYDHGGHRRRPHVMNEDGDEIKSIDIVGHKIDHFSWCRLSQRGFT